MRQLLNFVYAVPRLPAAGWTGYAVEAREQRHLDAALQDGRGAALVTVHSGFPPPSGRW